MPECVDQYYCVFKQSLDYKKWKDATGRCGVKGNSLLSGRKQAKLLHELCTGESHTDAMS